ncbi:interferon regulatory factor 1b [Corythoichthys intestinalis]|uniref:interferon regulatory factor 1b n=1 Tax=Corythoichthys intestinalis TaxID=161448 RepID=UPI0025A5C917|nr:interferon regulatory factor 1b [Corythoichthys intestinalis]XP_061801650.1 interferon regulatory factor 2-like [Nerophis lumbriciformis]
MPVSREKMRPWLVRMIESKSVAGLTWLDKEKTMFSIPWKHAARHGWDMNKDASLFKMWAIHTGKYMEGNSPDAKTWKANFRCAMNSLPDIEEVKDKSVNKGQSAMRVFRILPQKPKEKRSKAKAKSRKQVKFVAEDSDYSDTQSPLNPQRLHDELPSPQENVVDSTVGVNNKEGFNPFELNAHLPGSFEEKFQISPEHSPDYEYDIVEICQQLEREAQKMNFYDNKEFLSPHYSPGSQWSDSSADDSDEPSRMYTTLSTEIPLSSYDSWSDLHSQSFGSFRSEPNDVSSLDFTNFSPFIM